MQGFFGARSEVKSAVSKPFGARAIAFWLGVLMLATILPVLRAQPALAADLAMAVDTWAVNEQTGKVDYDLNLSASGVGGSGGPCYQTYCRVRVQGWYRVDGTEISQITFGDQQVPTWGAQSFSIPVTGSNVQMKEVTHLKFSVYGRNEIWSGWYQVSNPYQGGGVTLDINSWTRDNSTGNVSYDVTMRLTGAGQHGGPCQGTNNCQWVVEAWNRDGTPVRQYTLGNGALSGGTWSFTKNLVNTYNPMKEVTHLYAKIYYNDPGRETYETAWIPVGGKVPDGNINLTVNQWNRNATTGAVGYNLTLKVAGAGQRLGPCQGTNYCQWNVRAYLRNGTTDTLQYYVKNGSRPGGTWSFTESIVGTNISGKQVTHLQAEVYYPDPANEKYTTGWIPVDGLSEGAIDLDVASWSRDTDTGEVSYDVGVTIKDATATPACASTCAWKVEAFYDDGTVEEQQLQLGAQTLSGPVAVFGTRLTGSHLYPGEITELRASVTPAGATEPQYTDVVQVSDPYPDGVVDIEWLETNMSSSTGSLDYTMTLAIHRAAQVGGPCEVDCTWDVTYIDSEGHPTFVDSGVRTAGTWNYETILTGSLDMTSIEYVQVELHPIGSSSPMYTDSLEVGHDLEDGIDSQVYAAALAPALAANPSTFCDKLLVLGGISLDGDSEPDGYRVCLGALELFANLTGMALADAVIDQLIEQSPDPRADLDALVEEHEGSPIPEPGEATPVPYLPENGTDYEFGCKQTTYISQATIDKVTKWHLWGSAPMKSWFYPYPKTDWKFLARDYSRKEVARPSIIPNSPFCVRRVEYSRKNVGIEWNKPRGVYGQPTRIYTVLTWAQTGEIFNSYPGEPAELSS
jgi:hypothetical protein